MWEDYKKPLIQAIEKNIEVWAQEWEKLVISNKQKRETAGVSLLSPSLPVLSHL